MPNPVQYRQGRRMPPVLQVGGPIRLPKRVDGQEDFARPIGVAEFVEIKGVPRDTFGG